ncbi:MAG TPA: aminopeptidase [Gammaproteobacteria bacterium]
MSQLPILCRCCRDIATSLLVLLCTSCGELNYYSQALRGHVEIMKGSRPIEQLLTLDTTPKESKKQLKAVLEIRKFASEILHLPDNNSYKSFTELKRDYVVWNVFAAAEFSTDLLTWCFPITGCLPYRGYFGRNDALDYARQLESEGHDVHVGGVSAYSTLGWFADPVLDTMLGHGMTWAARIIFHELAHQKLYIQNDTELNEAFADTVAMIGVRMWLQSNSQDAEYESFREQLVREADFHALVTEFRERYKVLYAQDMPDDEKRRRKEELHRDMYRKYHLLKEFKWGKNTEYDTWFGDNPNNARIGTITTYRDLAPQLEDLYLANGGDIQKFYETMQTLSVCTRDERRKFLADAHTETSSNRSCRP